MDRFEHRTTGRGGWVLLVMGLWSVWCAGSAWAGDAVQAQGTPRLVRLVRQDCGSCHGMRLTGGLGPALTPERLADWPLASLEAVIAQGRPGTPMPPWGPMLSASEVRWIAQQLQGGFPQDTSLPALQATP